MGEIQPMPCAPDAILPAERFAEAFVAELVTMGWRSIVPWDAQTRRGLSAVVDFLDAQIERFEDQSTDWERVAPWVRTVNDLRPSALGGVEGWELQLRAAQGYFTRVSNPSYATVDFAISKAVAVSELDRLTDDQKGMIHGAVDAFMRNVEDREDAA